jgi:hypothetical protein
MKFEKLLVTLPFLTATTSPTTSRPLRRSGAKVSSNTLKTQPKTKKTRKVMNRTKMKTWTRTRTKEVVGDVPAKTALLMAANGGGCPHPRSGIRPRLRGEVSVLLPG